VIGIFKQKNPGNALVLLLYALVLKFAVFLHPFQPVLHSQDNYLYRFLLTGLHSVFQEHAFPYSILAFLVLFSQATLFNSICNYHKLLPKTNFLPGMSFILVTSLVSDWNHFSAPLLVNSIMIWSWYKMIGLYNNPRPVTAIFNIGLLAGLATLLYLPAVAFCLLVLFALLIMRPFRMQEWLVGFLGFTSPYYFLLFVLYFAGQLHWNNVLPKIALSLPALPSSIPLTLGLVLLVIPFIIGGYFVQANLNKMLIQVRKSWSLILMYLMVGVLVILFSRTDSYENWIVTAMPFAAFHAAAYYYPTSKAVPLVLHWLCFGFILVVSYFT
jgi:hypothetical protein